MTYKRISPQPVVEGGTNATSMTNTDGVVYYDGTRLVTTTVGVATQVLTSNGPGMAPTFQAGGGGGGITTIDGDTGSATGATITFNANANSGASMQFIASGASVDFSSTDTNGNTMFGQGCGISASASTNNVAMGLNALGSLNDGIADGNVVIGQAAANNLVNGYENTIIGQQAFQGATNNNENGNTVVGYFALNNGNNCVNNIAIGEVCMENAHGVQGNIFIGQGAGGTLAGTGVGRDGTFNMGLGIGTIQLATTANFNVAIGTDSMPAILTGVGNIAIGTADGSWAAGNDWNSNESWNINIQNRGVAGESNTMRLGTSGSGTDEVNRCFIAGIAGVTVANTAAVLIDTTTGQLGTVVSSERYKEDIRPLENGSSFIFDLQPVKFKFKSGSDKSDHVGLIAEQVEKVAPALVVYNKQGQPDTVKYHDLPVLLLNEIIKLRTELDELKRSNNGIK